MKRTIIICFLLLIILSSTASALSFSNFSIGGSSGKVNTGNGYYDNDGINYGYSDSRNVYTITESTQIWMFEPISYAGGGSAYERINSSLGTLSDAIVHNGYLYFVDGTTLKKKKSRNSGIVCESTDTGVGGCVQVITTGVGTALRVNGGKLYFTVGTTTLKHLDAIDNVVSDFSVCAPYPLQTQHGSFGLATKSGVLTAYIMCGGSPLTMKSFNSTTTTVIIASGIGNDNEYTSTFYTTNSYVYVLARSASAASYEYLVYISNNTLVSIDYITDNNIAANNRAYVGGKSTIGLSKATTSTYETYNSNEAGIDSLPTSPISGNVFYDAHTVSVSAPTYYNNSVIPINYDVRFYISMDNFTTYSNLMSWNLVVEDPSLMQTTIVNDLTFSCVQALPWWDTFGFFRVISFGTITGNEPYGCSAVSSINYAPATGTFWQNGTFTVGLYEDYLTNHALLGSDTWNVINQSSNTSTIITKPSPVGGINGGNPMKEQTDNFLSGGMFVALIMIFLFIGAGQMIGGFMGAAVGFGGGFIFAAVFGLIPTWALFLFAILVITLFAIMLSAKVIGGGEGGD